MNHLPDLVMAVFLITISYLLVIGRDHCARFMIDLWQDDPAWRFATMRMVGILVSGLFGLLLAGDMIAHPEKRTSDEIEGILLSLAIFAYLIVYGQHLVRLMVRQNEFLINHPRVTAAFFAAIGVVGISYGVLMVADVLFGWGLITRH